MNESRVLREAGAGALQARGVAPFADWMGVEARGSLMRMRVELQGEVGSSGRPVLSDDVPGCYCVQLGLGLQGS